MMDVYHCGMDKFQRNFAPFSANPNIAISHQQYLQPLGPYRLLQVKFEPLFIVLFVRGEYRRLVT